MQSRTVASTRAGLVIAALVALPVGACGGSKEREAESAQARADELHLQAQEQQASAERARELDQEAAQKEQEAQRKKAEANEAFNLSTADAIARIQGELDRERSTIDAIDKANAKAAAQSPRARQAEQQAMLRVRELRRTLEDDMESVRAATSVEWPGLKAKVDGDIRAYRDAVSDVADLHLQFDKLEGTAGTRTKPSGTRTTPGDTSHPLPIDKDYPDKRMPEQQDVTGRPPPPRSPM
jgi:hypothetical protein